VTKTPATSSFRKSSYTSLTCTHTSAYVNIRTQSYVSIRQNTSTDVIIRQHRSAYVSVRQHTSAYVSMSDFLAKRHWDKLWHIPARSQYSVVWKRVICYNTFGRNPPQNWTMWHNGLSQTTPYKPSSVVHPPGIQDGYEGGHGRNQGSLMLWVISRDYPTGVRQTGLPQVSPDWSLIKTVTTTPFDSCFSEMDLSTRNGNSRVFINSLYHNVINSGPYQFLISRDRYQQRSLINMLSS
jgi:hypothetical protein